MGESREPRHWVTRPEPLAWVGVGRGIGVGPLSLSLSPSKGERGPFSARVWPPADSPIFPASGCLRLAACKPRYNFTTSRTKRQKPELWSQRAERAPCSKHCAVVRSEEHTS